MSLKYNCIFKRNKFTHKKHHSSTFIYCIKCLCNYFVIEPWSAQMSKKSGHKYYFSLDKNKKPRSEYFIPDVAVVDTLGSYTTRVLWPWEPSPNAVFDNLPHSGLTRSEFEDYIVHNTNR